MADDASESIEHFAPKYVQLRLDASASFPMVFAVIAILGGLLIALYAALASVACGLVIVLVVLNLVSLVADHRFRTAALGVERDAILVRAGVLKKRLRLAYHREGWLESCRDQMLACVRTQSSFTLACALADQPQAERFLDAAGVDPNARVAAWQMATSSFPKLVSPLTRVSRVHVGIDGLVLFTAFNRRFVPYRDITEIERSPEEPSVALRVTEPRGTRTWVLRPGLPVQGGDVKATAECADDLFDLIQSRLDDVRTADPVDAIHLQSPLDRRHQSLETWIRKLEQLGRGFYRTHAVVPRELAGVLDNAAATAEQRIGAALALTVGNVPGSRDRVRTAANRCAEPKLRLILERVAASESRVPAADLERLIDELESEASPRRTAAESET